MARGITDQDVFGAADALLGRGERPTIERVRLELGRGSPNTVNRHLDAWWGSLASRMKGGGQPSAVPASLMELCSTLFKGLRDHALKEAQAVLEEGQAAREEDRINVERMVETVRLEKLAIDEVVEKLREDLNALRIRNEGLVTDRARLTNELDAARAQNDLLKQRNATLQSSMDDLREKSTEALARKEAAAQDREAQLIAQMESLRAAHRKQGSAWVTSEKELRGRLRALSDTTGTLEKQLEASERAARRAAEQLAKERERRAAAEAASKATHSVMTSLNRRLDSRLGQESPRIRSKKRIDG